MCRFILVKSEKEIKPIEILNKFSVDVKKNKTPDGDLQEDGWGFCYLNEKDQWQIYKSIKPIWEETKKFSEFPKCKMFLSHARSASFVNQKGFIEFNQPYISKDYAFVFNGLLKGVNLPNIPGKIGAEKIWNMLQIQLKKENPKKALASIKNKLLKSSREIVALNIGLADKDGIYSLNFFTSHKDYYQMFKSVGNNAAIVCSSKISYTT